MPTVLNGEWPRAEAERNGKGLTERQELAAVALAGGATIPAAARAGNCGATTVSTWLADVPAFKRRIRELREAATARAVGIIARGMAEAAITLRRLLRSKSEQMRHRAAESLLTHGAQLHALAELQDRVSELEDRR